MKNWKNTLFAALAAGFMTLGLFSPVLADTFGVYVNPGRPYYYPNYESGYYDPYVYDWSRHRHHYSPYTGWYGYGNYGWHDGYYHRGSDVGRFVGSILDWVF